MMTEMALNIPHILEQHRLWLFRKGGSRADLSDANLSGADLSDANLYRANLSRADLYHANLYHANLSGANLYRANLYGANLYHANLYGANLSGANLSGANLFDANLLDCGHRSDGFRFIASKSKDGTLMIKAGCRFFSIADAREHWTKTRGGTQLGNESIALLDHAERMASILGWNVP